MAMAVDKTPELWERDELPAELKWIDSLSPRHQRLFYGELQFEWSRYCATRDEGRLVAFFEDWQATAAVDADPEHAAFLRSKKDGGDYDDWKAAS